jgi:glycogen synthase
MKILVISNLYPPHYIGGFEIRCLQVSNALAERGHDVVILTSVNGVASPCVEDAVIPIHRKLQLYLPFTDPVSGETIPFALNRRRRWSVTRRNYRITGEMIEKHNPDLIFVWSQSRLSMGSVRAAMASGKPIAWTFGDPNIKQYKPASFMGRGPALMQYIQDNYVWKKATWSGINVTHGHCVSEDIKRRIVKAGLPIHNAKVIYRGIPIEDFPLRENPGSLHKPIRLLFVGQIHSYKGVHTLIAAVHRLTARYGASYLTLSIVGDGVGEYKRQLVEQVQAGPTRVEFLGKVPHNELSLLYRQHDIFVFPSAGGGYEGFGATALEAMASGLPVVGTTQGGMAELFVHEKNALVFEAEQPDDLAEKLERLISDAELRKRLALAARKQMESDFTMAGYADKMEQYLVDAAKAR